MTTAPIILVPGFWLGAWAWDEVAAALRADGHDVTALTLPGLESADTDRSSITLSDHVDAICDAVRAAGGPVVLAVHSGTGFSGYAASDRVPEQIAAMVYVDSGAGQGAAGSRLRRRREAAAVWEELAEEENLDGLDRGAARDVPAARRAGAGRRAARGGRADERRPARHPDHHDLHRLHVRGVQGRRRRRATPGSPASPSCATSPGSTCRRATGRCGRARRSSPRSSATSRRRTAPTRRRATTGDPFARISGRTKLPRAESSALEQALRL